MTGVQRCALPISWIFEELTGERSALPTDAEVIQELRWVIGRAREHWGEERAARNLRKFYPWYLERLGLDGAAADAFQRSTSLEEVEAHLARLETWDSVPV